MNGKKLKFSALFVAALIIGLSMSSNPSNGRTGAPDDGFCTDCHGSPSSTIDGFVDISGVPNNIDPNTTYTITVTSEFTSGSPTRAGFQMVVLDLSDDDVGTLSNPSTSSTITPSNGRTYFEHSPSLNFNGNSSVSWEVDWTSPSGPDMEDITFYASSILANGNGNNSTDKMKLTNVSGTMDAPTSVIAIELIDVEDITCFEFNDGFALVEVTGGTPPYSFDWDNGETTNPATSLGPDDNILTVTDDLGDTETINVFISEPDELVLFSEWQDVSCSGLNDGWIISIPNGGTGSYSYDWSNGETTQEIFDLSPGAYEVIVTDDNGCDEISTFVILDPPIVNIDVVNISDADCIGLGSIAIETSGGTGALTATWSNGDIGNAIENLEAGTYSVDISDSFNCTITESYTVSGPTVLDYDSESINIVCNGINNGSIELLFLSPSDFASISWSNNETSSSIFDLAAGNYGVTIEDNFGCFYEETFAISEPTAVEITSFLVNPVDCNSLGSIEIVTNGGTGTLTAEWDNGLSGNVINGLSAGVYSVELYDTNDCVINQSFTVEENANITYETEFSNPSCNGLNNGSIDLIIAPNDYSSITWNTGATTTGIVNAGPGTYAVTILDQDLCEYNETFVITEPNILNITAAPSNQILCFGDVIDTLFLNLTGGSAPYMIFNGTTAISDTLTNLAVGNYTFNTIDTNGCLDTVFFNTANPTQLAGTVTSTNTTSTTSMDGSAVITMTGGTPPYNNAGNSFMSSQTINGLSPGPYQYGITDANGCGYTINLTIADGTIPCNLQLNLTLTQPTCIGDEPIFSPTIIGGTPPYMMVFQSQSFYDGDYTVSFVDANNCSISEVVTINYSDDEAPVLNLVDVTVALDQNGDLGNIDYDAGTTDNCGAIVSLELTTPLPDCTAGPGPTTMTVIATDDIGNSSTGSFLLTIIDDLAPTIFCLDDTTITSCTDFIIPDPIVMDNCGTPQLTTIGSDQLTIGTNEIIYMVEDAFGNMESCTVIITVDVEIGYDVIFMDPLCTGESSGSYEVIGINPSTIIYENGFVENLSLGVYHFTVIDDESGCMVSDSIVLTDPEILSVSNEIIFPVSAGGASDGAIEITVLGGAFPYNYSWLDQDGNEVSTEDVASNLSEGIYHCNITDDNGCLLKTENYMISFESAVDDSYLNQVEIYPNPFTKDIFIQSPRSLDAIKVYNAQGKLVLVVDNPSNSIQLDILDAGLYLLEICESEEKAFKRIIKQ